ncbi:MAG: RpiB/LacA/LacB family sugar-phosphate isomerase [Candidatus Omnitrophota bacterium]
MDKRIAVGSDHGGFDLKQFILKELERAGHKVYDMGTDTPESCDYPHVGFECASMVSRKKAWVGILICRTGVGMAVIANKLPGVRAGVCGKPDQAVSAREHNDINVLVLAADRVSRKDALATVKAWLKTPALKGRHAKRVRIIKEYEKKVFKKT